MKRSEYKKICFEMAILQITTIQPLVGLPELIHGIKSMRSKSKLPDLDLESNDSVNFKIAKTDEEAKDELDKNSNPEIEF